MDMAAIKSATERSPTGSCLNVDGDLRRVNPEDAPGKADRFLRAEVRASRPSHLCVVPFREVASPMNVEKAPVRTTQPRLTPWLDAWKRLRAPRSCGQICEVGDRAAPRAEVEASLGE
jgi:hypothetical protein